METESQAKIAIRGKGSVKEGKGRSDAAHTSNQEEDLHCLIMADTEEKVNKAKKLIHNIIETVSFPLHILPSPPRLTTSRLHPFPKVRTSLSAINCVNSLLSTVLSVTMRIKLARTVVKSVTANTIALNSATLQPISSAVSVEMLVTWLGIAQTVSVVKIIAMVLQPVLQLVALVLEMLLTESTR